MAETLRSPTPAPIDRVFTIYFPDEATAEAFFSDEGYLDVKRRHFDGAVATTTIMTAFDSTAG